MLTSIFDTLRSLPVQGGQKLCISGPGGIRSSEHSPTPDSSQASILPQSYRNRSRLCIQSDAICANPKKTGSWSTAAWKLAYENILRDIPCSLPLFDQLHVNIGPSFGHRCGPRRQSLWLATIDPDDFLQSNTLSRHKVTTLIQGYVRHRKNCPSESFSSFLPGRIDHYRIGKVYSLADYYCDAGKSRNQR
jgi:hypothetical protein